MFSTRLENYLPYSFNLELLSANSFSFEESKIVIWEWVNIIISNNELKTFAVDELNAAQMMEFVS